mmetsp:Transcript_946/g.2171  ORF Transcript_946/g.2171 Transcript_946/m.2171 type:complete len:231 (+) Transcript_946:293-985(+)
MAITAKFRASSTRSRRISTADNDTVTALSQGAALLAVRSRSAAISKFPSWVSSRPQHSYTKASAPGSVSSSSSPSGAIAREDALIPSTAFRKHRRARLVDPAEAAICPAVTQMKGLPGCSRRPRSKSCCARCGSPVRCSAIPQACQTRARCPRRTSSAPVASNPPDTVSALAKSLRASLTLPSLASKVPKARCAWKFETVESTVSDRLNHFLASQTLPLLCSTLPNVTIK